MHSRAYWTRQEQDIRFPPHTDLTEVPIPPTVDEGSHPDTSTDGPDLDFHGPRVYAAPRHAPPRSPHADARVPR